MTLVLSYGVSGNFVAMTSDTRVVRMKEWFEFGSFEAEEQDLEILDEKDIKTYRLSKYVLVGGGGVADLSEYLINALKQRVKPGYDLEDCKITLEYIIGELKSRDNKPSFLKYIDEKAGVTVIMNGFYRDGCTGDVAFSGGKDKKVECRKFEKGRNYYNMIAPAEELKRQAETGNTFIIPELENQEALKKLPKNTADTLIQGIVCQRLLHIHYVISYDFPVQVSPDMQMHVIELLNDNYNYKITGFDLTENHKQLEEMRKE